MRAPQPNGAPSYDATPAYGVTQPYPQLQPPGYGYPPPAPGRPPGRPGLGIWSLVAAIAGTLAGSAITLVGGVVLSSAAILPSAGSPDETQVGQTLSTVFGSFGLMTLGFVVYAVFAVWGLTQGIFATVLNRGRGSGIAAIVVASTGWILVTICLWAAMLFGFADFFQRLPDVVVSPTPAFPR